MHKVNRVVSPDSPSLQTLQQVTVYTQPAMQSQAPSVFLRLACDNVKTSR